MVEHKDQSDNDFIFKIAEAIYEIKEIKKNDDKIAFSNSVDKTQSCIAENSDVNKAIDQSC